ncbi:hypothetical protein A3K64_02665 [Candidatus Micrarchaeota archaeon RBG_16_36_9]|nr:MAG: hypothetical protein A3K64_02665 [Candidatus Micrarchaeota archaeon RBG_16_36_9]
MLGQTRLEFIFGVVVFAMIILYIVNQMNNTFSTAIRDYELDSLKAEALNIIKTMVETSDIEKNYTVQVPIDVILVNDISSSMDGDGSSTCKLPCNTFGSYYCNAARCSTCPNCYDCDGNGYNADPSEPNCSINDARIASKLFVDLLNSTIDQSGLVTFNRTAYHSQNLTFSKNTVKNAIDNIRTRDDTAIANGIGNATEELTSIRARSDAKKIEILLTDGRDDPCCTDSEGAAQDARDNNITIYTIGVGSRSYLDEDLLMSVASIGNGKYFYVPNSYQLSNIYEEIAYEIKTDIIKIGIITDKPYIVSQEKVYNLSQNCNNFDITFNLKDYRLKIYNSTHLLLLCGIQSSKPPRVFVIKSVLIENELGNITLEVW